MWLKNRVQEVGCCSKYLNDTSNGTQDCSIEKQSGGSKTISRASYSLPRRVCRRVSRFKSPSKRGKVRYQQYQDGPEKVSSGVQDLLWWKRQGLQFCSNRAQQDGNSPFQCRGAEWQRCGELAMCKHLRDGRTLMGPQVDVQLPLTQDLCPSAKGMQSTQIR